MKKKEKNLYILQGKLVAERRNYILVDFAKRKTSTSFSSNKKNLD
jgi:hypothetical protein